MFDTPDILPLCVAPFVAILVGVIVYIMGYVIWSVIGKWGLNRFTTKKIYSKLIIGFIAVVFAWAGCIASIGLRIGAWSPAPWFSPTNNTVIGEWILSTNSINHLQDWYDFSVPTHKLVFNEDGTFYSENIPTFWGVSSAKENKDSFITGTGTWYLGQIPGTERMEWIVFTNFQFINGQEDDRQMRFYFEGHLPPYQLVTLDSTDLKFRFEKK